MDKLRVAIVTGIFPAYSETFIYNQIADLLKKGCEVEIFAYHKGNTEIIHKTITDHKLSDLCSYYHTSFVRQVLGIVYKIIARSYSVAFLWKNQSRESFNRLSYFRSFRYKAVSSWFKSRPDFDVIHVHFGMYAIPVATYLKNHKKLNTKLVVTFHGFDLQPSDLGYLKWLYKPMLSRADALTVNTPYLAEILHQIYPPANKTYIIPVGLDTKLFRNSGLSDSFLHNDIFRIVLCGRLVPLKAPDHAIEISHILAHQMGLNIHLTIIGDGPMYDQIRCLIEEKNLRNFVTLKGALTQEEIIEEMKKSHVLLSSGIVEPITGRSETQGLVIQEAQAMGLPVVVSDAGGAKYGVKDGKTGFVVEEGNFIQYAEKIKFLINNPAIRQQMGKDGREFVENNYDSKIIGDRLLALYNPDIFNPGTYSIRPPLVSVIMPCYNLATWLPDALQSVLDQTYSHWECIVVDDGSTDQSAAIAAEWALSDRRFKLIRQPNRGVSAARNAALKAATGDYFQFLDADDVIHPEKFSLQLALMKDCTRPAISISSYTTSTEHDLNTPEGKRFLSPVFKTTRHLHELITRWETRLSIPMHCFLFDATLFRDHGILFDESLPNHVDWECWMNVFRLGPEVMVTNRVLATYRIRGNAMCANLNRMKQGFLAAIAIQKGKFSPDSVEYRLLQRKEKTIARRYTLLIMKNRITGILRHLFR